MCATLHLTKQQWQKPSSMQTHCYVDCWPTPVPQEHQTTWIPLYAYQDLSFVYQLYFPSDQYLMVCLCCPVVDFTALDRLLSINVSFLVNRLFCFHIIIPKLVFSCISYFSCRPVMGRFSLLARGSLCAWVQLALDRLLFIKKHTSLNISFLVNRFLSFHLSIPRPVLQCISYFFLSASYGKDFFVGPFFHGFGTSSLWAVAF